MSAGARTGGACIEGGSGIGFDGIRVRHRAIESRETISGEGT